MSNLTLRWTAAAVATVGLIAALVIPPARCGMDEFECFENRNSLRVLVAILSVTLAVILFVASFNQQDRDRTPPS